MPSELSQPVSHFMHGSAPNHLLWSCAVLSLMFTLAARAERIPIAQVAITPEILQLTSDQAKAPIPIWDLSFSPDGSMLAIGAATYLKGQYATAVVLIVSARQPDVVLYRFEIPDEAIIDEDQTGQLLWLPESDGLIVSNQRILIDLNSKSQDWLDTFGELYDGMLSGRRMITSTLISPDNTVRYTVHSPAGDVLSTWTTPWLTSISAVSFRRDAIALCTWVEGVDGIQDNYCENRMLGLTGSPFPSAWVDHSAPTFYSTADFGDRISPGAHTRRPEVEDGLLCGGKYLGYRSPVVLTCWSVDTGQEFRELPNIGMWPGSPLFVGGTRAALGDFDISVCPSCEANDHGPLQAIFRRRVVIDVSSGIEVASWQPEYQTVQETWEPEARTIRFRFALSPDGEYLAEGGAGIVQLYRLTLEHPSRRPQ